MGLDVSHFWSSPSSHFWPAALEESAQNDVGKVVRRQDMHFQRLQQASLPTSRWLKAELHGSMCLESYCRFLVGTRVSVPGKSSLVFVGWSFFGQIESLGTSLVHLGRWRSWFHPNGWLEPSCWH
jgi:hypothetical protein